MSLSPFRCSRNFVRHIGGPPVPLRVRFRNFLFRKRRGKSGCSDRSPGAACRRHDSAELDSMQFDGRRHAEITAAENPHPPIEFARGDIQRNFAHREIVVARISSVAPWDRQRRRQRGIASQLPGHSPKQKRQMGVSHALEGKYRRIRRDQKRGEIDDRPPHPPSRP